MKIVVVAATAEEIALSRPFLDARGIEYLITGVGMLACTFALTKRLRQKDIDLLIQVGIGGILDPTAKLGDIYRITEDEIFEFGAEDGDQFLDIEALGFGKRLFSEHNSNLPSSFAFPKKAKGITVNKVHGNQESIVSLHEHFPPTLIESMEGAAFFYVAEQEQTAALQFRAVSNYIEPRNRAAWNIGLALKNLNKFLQELLTNLS